MVQATSFWPRTGQNWGILTIYIGWLLKFSVCAVIVVLKSPPSTSIPTIAACKAITIGRSYSVKIFLQNHGLRHSSDSIISALRRSGGTIYDLWVLSAFWIALPVSSPALKVLGEHHYLQCQDGTPRWHALLFLGFSFKMRIFPSALSFLLVDTGLDACKEARQISWFRLDIQTCALCQNTASDRFASTTWSTLMASTSIGKGSSCAFTYFRRLPDLFLDLQIELQYEFGRFE